jgi:hypothetical protein
MQEDNKINFKTIKTLGPSILKVEIPKVVVDKLNSYVDEIIINKKKYCYTKKYTRRFKKTKCYQIKKLFVQIIY